MSYMPGALVAFDANSMRCISLEIIITADVLLLSVLTRDKHYCVTHGYDDKAYGSVEELISATDECEPIVWSPATLNEV